MEAQDSMPVPDATIEEREDIEMQQIIMSPTDSLVLEVSAEEKTKENDKPKDIALDSKTEVQSHCLPGSEEEISPTYALSCTMLAEEKETVEMAVSSEKSSSGTNIATSSKDHDRSQPSASGSSSAPSLSHIKSAENEKASKISSSSLNRIIPFIYISDVGEHSTNLIIPERTVKEEPNSNVSTSISEKDEVQNVDSALILQTEVESHCLSGSEEEISQRCALLAMLAKEKEILESLCFSGSEEEISQRYEYACAMLAKEKEITVSSEESSSGTNIATSSKDHDSSQTSASGSSSAANLSHITENVKFSQIFSPDNEEFSEMLSFLDRIMTNINISEAIDCALNFRLFETAFEEEPNSNTSTSNSEKDEVQNVDSAQDLSNTRDESNINSTEPPKCESCETSSANLTNEDSITLSNCTEAESSDELNNVKREEGISSDISQLAADSINAVSAEMTENETEGHVSTTQPA